MARRFKTTAQFKKSFSKLTKRQQQRAREAYKVFKVDPFSSCLRTHKIHKLSADAGTNVYSVTIEGNLRAVFILEDNDVVRSFDIGTHDIYR